MESISRMVAEKTLCEAEGRRKARGLRRARTLVGVGSTALGLGLGASFRMGLLEAELILSGREVAGLC